MDTNRETERERSLPRIKACIVSWAGRIVSFPVPSRIIQEVIISPSLSPHPFYSIHQHRLPSDYILFELLLFDMIKFMPFRDDIWGKWRFIVCFLGNVFFSVDGLKFRYQLSSRLSLLLVHFSHKFHLFSIIVYFRKLNYLCWVERSKTTGRYFFIYCILSSYLGMFFRLDNDVIIPITSFIYSLLFSISENWIIFASWTFKDNGAVFSYLLYLHITFIYLHIIFIFGDVFSFG